MKISAMTNEDFLTIQNAVQEAASKASSLAEAANLYMSILQEHLGESIVLARLFATVSFEELPEKKQAFVSTLVKKAGVEEHLKPESPILTLFGSKGVEPEWNDVENSENHVGIPLVSSAFIGQIPMMSRLLKQLGMGLEWIDTNDTQLVVRAMGRSSGVFYVRDAATELDVEGRLIIPTQDFVEQYGVKTVFGIGGGYLGSNTFFTLILFLNETIEPEMANKFSTQVNKFKTATMEPVDSETFFQDVK